MSIDSAEEDTATDGAGGATDGARDPNTGTSDWCVYIVLCADGSLYTGIARDCMARIGEHNSGNGAKYTRSRRPVSLVYRESAASRSTAQRREHEIKRLPRAAKMELIAGALTAPRAAATASRWRLRSGSASR